MTLGVDPDGSAELVSEPETTVKVDDKDAGDGLFTPQNMAKQLAKALEAAAPEAAAAGRAGANAIKSNITMKWVVVGVLAYLFFKESR